MHTRPHRWWKHPPHGASRARRANLEKKNLSVSPVYRKVISQGGLVLPSGRSPLGELANKSSVYFVGLLGLSIMPLSRKRKYNGSRRKRTYKRRRTAKRAFGLAKKAYKLSKQETRHYDLSAESLAINWSVPIIVNLNTLIEGDEEEDRQGDTITNMSLSCKFTITPPTTNTTTNLSVIRLLVFRWEPNLATGLNIDDLFTDVDQAQLVYSHFNWRNKGMFTVYYDKRFVVSTLANSKSILTWNKFIKFNFKTLYNDGDTGTIVDIQKNSLWFMAFSNDLVTEDNCRLAYNFRLKYLP